MAKKGPKFGSAAFHKKHGTGPFKKGAKKGGKKKSAPPWMKKKKKK